MDNKIGFVVWGIRNGFKNNWLSTNVDATLYGQLTDDMRQICNSTIDTFFSIEIIRDYTLLSIFNPNTKDHVQRKAYIALSIIIPYGYFLKGDVTGTLKAMMQTYVVKQGNAMVNMVNTDDMKVHLKALQLSANYNAVQHVRNKIGLFKYIGSNEIQTIFQNPSIYEFKKVFFISGQNVALEKMQGIEHVHAFSKSLLLTFSDFDSKYFSVTINNQQITATKSSVKQGDLIQLIELKTKRGKQLQVGQSDVHISMLELFPPPFELPKSKGKNKPKFILIGSLVLCLVAGATYFFITSKSNPQLEIDDPSPMVKTMEAVYDFEKLRLSNLPIEDNLTWFAIYRLTNDSIPFDSLNHKNPVLVTSKLKATADTFIWVQYRISDRTIRVSIPVHFETPKVYKIKSGETLSVISERFNIKKDSLMLWNNITDENKINLDQVIKLNPEYLGKTQNIEEENAKLNNTSTANESSTKTTEKTMEEFKSKETVTLNKDNSIVIKHESELKKEADVIISELKKENEDVSVFETRNNGCNNKVCFEDLIKDLKAKKNKL